MMHRWNGQSKAIPVGGRAGHQILYAPWVERQYIGDVPWALRWCSLPLSTSFLLLLGCSGCGIIQSVAVLGIFGTTLHWSCVYELSTQWRSKYIPVFFKQFYKSHSPWCLNGVLNPKSLTPRRFLPIRSSFLLTSLSVSPLPPSFSSMLLGCTLLPSQLPDLPP